MLRCSLLLLVACGGSPKPQPTPPTPPPVAAAPTCEHAVGRMVEMIVADQRATNADPADANTNIVLIQQMRPAMVESCTADHWSVELRSCIDGAADIQASDGCKKFLTQGQQEGMGKRMAALAAASAPPAQN